MRLIRNNPLNFWSSYGILKLFMIQDTLFGATVCQSFCILAKKNELEKEYLLPILNKYVLTHVSVFKPCVCLLCAMLHLVLELIC